MATDDHTEFDPRFDPAFQRGFDAAPPAVRPQPPRTATRAFERTAPPAPVALSPSYPQPVTETPAVVTSQAGPSVVSPVPHDDAEARLPTRAADDAAAEDWRRRNPFLLAVAVVSVALIAGGVWGVQAAREPFLQTNAAANTDYVGLQMLVLFAPLAIVLGLAAGIGILFFYAAAWQRRR